MRIAVFATLILFCITCFAADEDPFQSGVRPTDPLTAEQELASFQLPPGFEIQLVASEPDILKPLNMAFDARGRLWVTVTQEYPYAAPPDRVPQDALKILEDTDGDGFAEKVTTFADQLNIPIGVYPFKQGAIVFSIPHIWYLEDTDGDDVADKRTRLYGPMGFDRDTHGMNNAFRRGFDGWLYACHGFNNETRVAGTDGHQIEMQSGNTYRMRTDGSRVEHFTWGQVNPFGMAIDPLFNMFTADCHSKPITDLLRGGYYSSFGKPHDGLGFVPDMMEHLHGSTAICGIAHYAADDFPAEFRGNLFSGNVMTSRINRNSIEYHGATMLAVEEEDFLKSSDPWFRPVDLQLGPDGGLYIADFYNRIIGHYEVPLTHPGRDRTSGRIWRVVYKGDANQDPPPKFDISRAGTDELIAELGSNNLTRRMLAADQLADRVGASASQSLRVAAESSPDPLVRLHSMWVLFRLGDLDIDQLVRGAADTDSAVRVHTMKMISETPDLAGELAALARQGLRDPDSFVRRAAADALAQHPEHGSVDALIRCLLTTADDDRMLRHAVRISLRNQLAHGGRLAQTAGRSGSDRLTQELASIAIGVQNEHAGIFLVKYLSKVQLPAAETMEYLRHAANHVVPDVADELVDLAQQRFADNPDAQIGLLDAVSRGFQQRGAADSVRLRAWALTLAKTLLAAAGGGENGWLSRRVPNAVRGENPWVLEPRRSADGTSTVFLSSLPLGEQLTGSLRSPHFEVPEKFSFYIAGHSGFPDKPLTPNNHVRLCDARTGEQLMRAEAPRNDTAQIVEWDLSPLAGRQAYLEIVDADEGGAFAWLAVGRFEPPVISVPEIAPSTGAQRLSSCAEIVQRFKLDELRTELEGVLLRDDLDSQAAGKVASALLSFEPDARYEALAVSIGDGQLSEILEARTRQALLDRDDEKLLDLAMTIMQSVPARTQLSIATTMTADASGAQLLLELVRSGRASPRLLQAAGVAQQLKALADQTILDQAEELVSALPPPSEGVDRMIAERRRQYAAAPRSLEKGAAVFTKSCIACHQLAGKGAMVGPQLDGIGNRGLDRLLEDLLDPHRNVDVAFRTTTLVLTSGKIVSGLVRREEGSTLVLTDDQGKEFVVDKEEIDDQVRTNLSLMPENVATSLTPEDFFDLLAFLLAERGESGAE